MLILAATLCLALNARQEPLCGKVNLYIGTAGDYGQMSPGATVPYSQIQVCPDSKPRQHPGYDYEEPAISGFSINRLSGVGGSGCGGNVSLMPDATGEDVRLLKHTEQASPGYYSVRLSNGVWCTATASQRMAVERFSFPDPSKAVLLLNPRSAFDKVFGASFEQKSPGMGQGFAECANTCGRGHYLLHYRLYASSPFRLDTISDGRKRLTFPELSARYVEVRIVVSTGLADELDKMTEQMVWRTDFLSMVERAQRQWERLLSTVEVEGGTADQLLSLRGAEADFAVVKLADIAGQEAEYSILAAFSDERLPELPDVPTLKELGYYDGWLGSSRCVAAPAGVSEDVIAFYEAAFKAAMEDAEYVEAAEQAGMATDYKDAEATKALIEQQQVFAESLAEGFWYEDY